MARPPAIAHPLEEPGDARDHAVHASKSYPAGLGVTRSSASRLTTVKSPTPTRAIAVFALLMVSLWSAGCGSGAAPSSSSGSIAAVSGSASASPDAVTSPSAASIASPLPVEPEPSPSPDATSDQRAVADAGRDVRTPADTDPDTEAAAECHRPRSTERLHPILVQADHDWVHRRCGRHHRDRRGEAAGLRAHPPDRPGRAPGTISTVTLTAEASQSVKLIDGHHTFTATCQTSAGSVTFKSLGRASDGKPNCAPGSSSSRPPSRSRRWPSSRPTSSASGTVA